jgi:phospholipase/carboxylesterase
VSDLVYRERPAAADATGLLILHHGRGTDERDLLALGDALDPAHDLHIVTPRAPLQIAGVGGYHWYRVPRVGFPDPDTFRDAYAALGEFHDKLWRLTGIAAQRTILGGFSMGAVMSYALGLGGGRPRPAGILALSGFIPTVEGWQPDLNARQGMGVFIAHGSRDPVIEVGFARRARDLLTDGGLEVSYHESAAAHHIDPAQLPLASTWLAATLAA